MARLGYDDATEEERREAHRVLSVTATTDEERAIHLGRSVDAADEAIASDIERVAVAVRGPRSLIATLHETAARLTPASDREAWARRALAGATAWFEAGDLARAERSLETLVAGLERGASRAAALLELGIVLHEAGRWHEAMRRFDEALGEAGEPKLVADVRRRMAVTSGYISGVPEGLAHAEAALAAAEEAGDPETLTYCLATLGLAHVLGGDPPAVHGPYLDRALALEAGLERPLTGWTPRLVMAEDARLSVDIERARGLYAAVLDDAVAIGDATLEHWAAYGWGSTEVLAGDYRRAGELADHALELAETTGVLDLYARRLRAQVDAHLGLAPEARARALTALAAAEARGGRLHAMAAHAALGQLALASGDAGLAADDLRSARAIAVEMGYWNGVTIRAMLDEAEAAAVAGALDQASYVIDLVAARIGERPPAWAGPLLARARGLLVAARGDVLTAERLLERSAEETRSGTVPLDLGRALLVLGSARRRARHYGSARVALDEAFAIFGRLGAVLWAERARQELARIPGRRSGRRDALTEAEARIAALVAEGRSNKEVAASLFVSVKTVEAALTRVYEKVGVRSRAELAHDFAAAKE